MMTNLPVSELKANDTVYDVFGKGVINQNNSEGLKFWTGTREEYDSIEHSSDTVYNITDEGTTEYSANKNLSNLSSEGKNISNWSSNVSNCITEIPQDIKLELNNGTLTLKAGSKVYVPNGNGVFDVIITDSDLTTQGVSFDRPVFLFYSNGVLYVRYTGEITSGSTVPTDTYPIWYDTSSNKIKITSDFQTWTDTGYSLPLALLTLQTTTPYITSINQVFNGFGYIGSTVFTLPGVKGLFPNGRNEDGTLKSTPFTISNVLTQTPDWTGNAIIITNGLQIVCNNSQTEKYDESTNYTSYTNIHNFAFCGTCTLNSGVVSNFYPNRPFHAPSWQDASGLGMPSNKYINLTLGSSGTYYTAPANGYVQFAKWTGNTSQYISINTDTISIQVTQTASSIPRCFVPVKKGQRFQSEYSASGETTNFRFYYAEGEV